MPFFRFYNGSTIATSLFLSCCFRLGANAQIAEEIEQLSKANSRLERMLVKIDATDSAGSHDTHTRLDRERENAKFICGQILKGLRNLDSGPMTSDLTSSFQRQLKRFENISNEIKRKESAVLSRNANLDDGYGSHGSYRSNNQGGYGQQQQQQQQQQIGDRDQLLAYDVEDMRRRQEEIQAIERDVVEIHEMARDLNTMVHEQGEQLTHIDDVLTSAHNKTEQAYEELKGAEDYQRKARKRKCCIMIILLIVIAAVVLGIWQIAK